LRKTSAALKRLQPIGNCRSVEASPDLCAFCRFGLDVRDIEPLSPLSRVNVGLKVDGAENGGACSLGEIRKLFIILAIVRSMTYAGFFFSSSYYYLLSAVLRIYIKLPYQEERRKFSSDKNFMQTKEKFFRHRS
jgi:hypothetical protein